MKLLFALIALGHVIGFTMACLIVSGFKIDPRHPGDWPYVLAAFVHVLATSIGTSVVAYRFVYSREETIRFVQELV